MQQRRKFAQIYYVKIMFSQLVYLFVGDKRYSIVFPVGSQAIIGGQELLQ